VNRSEIRVLRDLIVEARVSVMATLPPRYVRRAPELLKLATRMTGDMIGPMTDML
jgi:hypothetical protein